jgi:hypothetical protein
MDSKWSLSVCYLSFWKKKRESVWDFGENKNHHPMRNEWSEYVCVCRLAQMIFPFILFEQFVAATLVVVMREERCVMQGSVQWCICWGMNSRGSQQRCMMSDSGCIMSRSMGQVWGGMDIAMGCIVTSISVDQGCRGVNWGMQCWCSHNWCHETCQISLSRF